MEEPTPAGFRQAAARHLAEGNLNAALHCVLVAGYGYYHLDESLLDDGTFDSLCKMLAGRWKEVTSRYKRRVSLADMKAGSTYALHKSRYPLIAKLAAVDLINQLENKA